MGDEKQCVAIYLTGLSDKGEVLKDPKVRLKSFSQMWEESNTEKREFINKVFGVSKQIINDNLNFKNILLTEPISEDLLIPEEEKIKIYLNLLKRIGRDDIVIKPHPREETDYSVFFPNYHVLDSIIPMQLLTLNGIKYDAAYSIRSSALFDFPYRIKVCVIGTEIHPILYNKCPDWSSKNIKEKITNKNIDFIELN